MPILTFNDVDNIKSGLFSGSFLSIKGRGYVGFSYCYQSNEWGGGEGDGNNR